MKNFFFIFLIFSSIVFSQEKNNLANENLSSPSNIKLFADFLFNQKDYLRAVDEYERYLNFVPDDTIQFKIALAYSLMNNFNEAAKRFNIISENSSFYKPARIEFLKSIFQTGNIAEFRYKYAERTFNKSYTDSSGITSLFMFSFLLTKQPLPDEGEFIKNFPISERQRIKSFFEWKEYPPEKSPLKAAIFSAIIPGSGKIYTNESWDGIFAFITTLGTGYLTYDNFKASHNFRGWIFGGLTAGFYGGNIYGSAAAVQIYNAHIRFDFINDLKVYIEDKNYFLKIFN
jgi:tetratricopeptide (TPR) repeat protein